MKTTQTSANNQNILDKQFKSLRELYDILGDPAAVNTCKLPDLYEYHEAKFELAYSIGFYFVMDIDYCIKYKGRRILDGRYANEEEQEQLAKLKEAINYAYDADNLPGMLKAILDYSKLISSFSDLQNNFINDSVDDVLEILQANPFAVVTQAERAAMVPLFN